MNQRTFVILVLCGVCALAGVVGAADVFLEATRPDFQKIPLGVVSIENTGGPDWLGGRLEEVLKKDVKRSLVFELMDLPSLGIKVRDVGNGMGNGSKAVFKQAAENGVSVLVWGKAGLKKGEKEDDVNMEGFVYDSGSDEVVGGKRYAGSPSVVRLMAHRFADELVFRYTGEPGIARTKIAYVSAHGAARELFVMDYDGYDTRQLTADGFLNLMPRWSPDRRFLVFTAYRDRNTQDIDMIELASGKRWTLVSYGGLNITPALSPDGNFLAFASSHAVIEGYGSLLAKGHHPTYVLFVDIDPDRIDVNVHPAKREIRFADQEMVYRFVRQTVRHAFSGVERKLVLGMGSEEPVAETASPDTMAERPRSGTLLRPGQRTVGEHSHWPVAASSDSLYVGESPASYANSQGVAVVPFGQVLRTYLVAQVGRELHVIDQHTAHERVLFQRLWRRWMQREMVIQPLLIPESIELTVAQATLLQKHLADLEQLGLALEPFGPSAVLLRGIPAGLGPVDGASLVRELLEDMTEWATTASLDARAQPVFATVAWPVWIVTPRKPTSLSRRQCNSILTTRKRITGLATFCVSRISSPRPKRSFGQPSKLMITIRKPTTIWDRF